MPDKKPTRKELKATEDVARLNELNDLRNLLADPRMRAFLWRFLEQCQMFSEHMNSNFGITGHNLGRRAAGMWMWNEITEADYEALLDMQRQHLMKQTELQAAANSEAAPDSQE